MAKTYVYGASLYEFGYFNFGGYLNTPTTTDFDDNINITYDGVVYEDRLTLTWVQGSYTYQSIFLGSDLTVNASHQLTGGLVESYRES